MKTQFFNLNDADKYMNDLTPLMKQDWVRIANREAEKASRTEIMRHARAIGARKACKEIEKRHRRPE